MTDRKQGFYKCKIGDTWAVAEWNTQFWWIHGTNAHFHDEHFDTIIETPIEFEEPEQQYIIIDLMHSDEFLYFIKADNTLTKNINSAKKYSEEEIKSIKIRHSINNTAIHRMAMPMDEVIRIFKQEIQFPMHFDELKLKAIKHKLDKYTF